MSCKAHRCNRDALARETLRSAERFNPVGAYFAESTVWQALGRSATVSGGDGLVGL